MAGAILAVKELVHVDNVRRLSPATGNDGAEPVADADAVWVDANGDVVDGGRASRRAPRGYRVVGNLLDAKRDGQLKAAGDGQTR